MCLTCARSLGSSSRLDRLPNATPLEGLKLLQKLWCEYDVAYYLAGRYKALAKLLYVLQLLLAWTVVLSATLTSTPMVAAFGDDGEYTALVKEVTFCLSIAAAFLVSLDGFLSAKSRWRQLRTAAGEVSSMAWCYRCRVAPFELEKGRPDSTRPEDTLCRALVKWRTDLTQGADLTATALRRKRSKTSSVFTHCQHSGEPVGTDDHHSPVRPKDYIEQRLLPSKEFYEKRLPWYARKRLLLKLLTLLATVAASILARFGLSSYVTLVTAFATAVTSWSEFSDTDRKMERYTRAIASIENLLSQWDSTGEVERASVTAIANLVVTGESIIANERLAWQSTATSRDDEAGAAEGESSSASAEAGPGKGGRKGVTREPGVWIGRFV